MKPIHIKLIGGLLIGVGVLVVIFGEQIVFPGLERLLGIETIVGHDSVVYFPDGNYGFTNPEAMIRWIYSVKMIGVLICLFGGWLLFPTRRQTKKI